MTKGEIIWHLIYWPQGVIIGLLIGMAVTNALGINFILACLFTSFPSSFALCMYGDRIEAYFDENKYERMLRKS